MILKILIIIERLNRVTLMLTVGMRSECAGQSRRYNTENSMTTKQNLCIPVIRTMWRTI